MQAQKNVAKEMLTDALGAPEGAVSVAWDAVKRHPLASLGAVAAGVGAYVLLRHFESDKPSASRKTSGRSRPARAARGRRPARRGARANADA
jgi:hypothetical protein